MRLTRARDPRENAPMRGVLKSAAVHLALAAMVLRALLPAGWMPNVHASGGPLMLCDGLAPPAMHDMADMPGMDHMAMPMAHHHHDAPPAAGHAAHTVCIFAAAAPLASPAFDVVVLIPTSASHGFEFAMLGETRVVSTAYRPNAARAPPFSA